MLNIKDNGIFKSERRRQDKNPFRQCRISKADIVTNFYLFNGRCGISISMILVKEGEL